VVVRTNRSGYGGIEETEGKCLGVRQKGGTAVLAKRDDLPQAVYNMAIDCCVKRQCRRACVEPCFQALRQDPGVEAWW